MGGREAVQTAQALLALGRPVSTPVLAIENCSLPEERILHLTLGELRNGLTGFAGPVLVVIGEAMAQRR